MLVALNLGAPHAASAQTGGKLALGADVSTRVSRNDDASGHVGVGLLWRFGHAKSGWGWHWGLNWYSTDLDRSIGGAAIDLGELHVRPVMAGYGYTHLFGRTAITATALAGYAYSSMSLTPAATAAFRDRLGAQSVSVDAANTLVFKPEVSAWYDINRKFGLKVSGGYMVARPRVTVRSTLGEDRRTVRADMLMLKAGVVYSIF